MPDLSAALLALSTLLVSSFAFAQVPATCVVSGTLLDVGSNPIPNAIVRVRTVSPTAVGNYGITTNDLTVKTAADGTWALTLIQGLKAQVDIPAVGIANDIIIPALSSVSFGSLTLYARGTQTPATIISNAGPSMGGDLIGTSPNPSVVGLRGQALAAGNCTTGQARVMSGGGTYTCQAVTAGTSVTSISAGTGIAVTGTASVPIVGLSAGGVTSTQLASGAASTNVGALGGDLSGTLPNPTIGAGKAALNIGALGGDLTGTLPNPTIGAGVIVNADVNAAAAIAWTKVSKVGAVPGDVGAENPSNKGVASGYVPLDGTAHISTAYLPVAGSAPAAHAATHATIGSDPITPISITAADRVHTHVESDVTSLPGDLANRLSLSAGGTVAGNVTFNGTTTFGGPAVFSGSFAPAGEFRVTKTADATGVSQLKNSNNSVFESSVWNGAAAERRLLTLRNTPTALNAGKLSFLGYSTDNVVGSEVAFIDATTGAYNGNTIGTHTGNVTGNVTGNTSGTAATFTGSLTGDVTSTSMATTVASVGGQTAANVAAGAVLANASTSANTLSAIVRRDGAGGFSAGAVTASSLVGPLTGNATTASDGLTSASGTAPLTLSLAAKALTGSVADATAGAKGVVQLAGDLAGTAAAPTVATVAGSTAANVHAAELLANAATNANTASTIVKRDASNNFVAGTVTANLTGNVTGNASGTAATFTGNLTGDATSTGMATSVVKIKGVNLGATMAAPSNGQCPVYNTGATEWQAGTCGSGGGGTITAVTASGELASSGGTTPNITVTSPVTIAHGGTGAATSTAGFTALWPATTLGDTIYSAAAGVATRLAGNTASNKQFLTSTGAAGLAAAPAWGLLAAGDIPSLPSSQITSGIFTVPFGGTGVGTLTGLLRGNGTSAFTGSAQASLTSEVSGTLPTASGGTNATAWTAGSIPYLSTGTTFGQDNANLFWDGTNHRLGLGTTTPGAQFQMTGKGLFGDTAGSNYPGDSPVWYFSSATTNVLMNLTASVAGGNGAQFTFRGSGHGGGSPQQTLANDWLGLIGFRGALDSSTGFETSSPARIIALATENHTSTTQGSAITFSTAANGTTSASERMRIDQSGNVGIGTTTPSAPLQVVGRIDGANTNRHVNVIEKCGLDPTGAVDGTTALNNCIAANAPGIFDFPEGTYLLTPNGITIAVSGTRLVGEGSGATVIKAAGGTAGPVFKFSAGASTVNFCGISGMRFTSTDTVTQKTMVQILDAKSFVGSDVVSADDEWKGATSIGFDVRGRQEIRLRDLEIYSDIPVNIGVNPNFASLSFDHSSIEGSHLLVTTGLTNACINIMDGLALTNSGFRSLALVRGGAGISFSNTTMATASTNIDISDIRTEQGAAATSYSIDLQSTSGQIQNVNIRDVQLELTRKGMRLKKVFFSQASGVVYNGALEWLNLDTTSGSFYFISGLIGSSATKTIGAGTRLFVYDADYVKTYQNALPSLGSLSGLGTGSAVATVNSTDFQGSIQLSPTGSPGSTGLATLTYNVALNTQASVILTIHDGTGAWLGTATVKLVQTTNANFTISWNNPATNLTAGVTYLIDYIVMPAKA